MEIILDSKLDIPDARKVHTSTETLGFALRELDRLVERRKGSDFRRVPSHFLTGDGIVRVDGFVGLLSRAYSRHLPIAIAPHDFWYIANCEFAAMVAKQPDAYREFFTTSAEKQTLLVPVSDPTHMDYTVLADMIENKIPHKELSSLLIPNLSSMEGMEFVALCASLADVVQHFYRYETYCCGIPHIKLRGDQEDYELLRDNAMKLAEIFVDHADANEYYKRIASLFGEMALSFEQNQTKFWRGIFTQKNVGSGGQLEINGWIREFFSDRPNDLENFSTSISIVPYKNVNTGREFVGAMGAFIGMETTDGYYQPFYEHVVYEKVQACHPDQ